MSAARAALMPQDPGGRRRGPRNPRPVPGGPRRDTATGRAEHPSCRPGRRVPFAGVSILATSVRRCTRTACSRPAIATLTYVYADSTAVLGPLATYAEPHCYDLCEEHSDRLTAPRGWEVVRLAPDPEALGPSSDDLEALANAVREAARPAPPSPDGPPPGRPPGGAGLGRRGHLRALPTP
jgi:Protein of unknown function (DUF3499)